MSDIADLDVKMGPSALDVKFVFLPKPLKPNRISCFSSPLRLFDIAKSQGRPLYAAAPMVRYSKVSQAVHIYGDEISDLICAAWISPNCSRIWSRFGVDSYGMISTGTFIRELKC
jgi:hypothetical protein